MRKVSNFDFKKYNCVSTAHTEVLRHAAEFWRSCHEQLYNEFTQFQQNMVGVPEDIRQQPTEQKFTVNALSLMSECLNLMQRMMGRIV